MSFWFHAKVFDSECIYFILNTYIATWHFNTWLQNLKTWKCDTQHTVHILADDLKVEIVIYISDEKLQILNYNQNLYKSVILEILK